VRQLGSRHAIYNVLAELRATHDSQHGKKVTIGVLVASLFLTDKPTDLIDEVCDFCATVDLPTTLAAIGLADVSDEDLMTVAEAADAEEETVHNEPMPVTPVAVVAALQAADALGRRRAADG
jgi:glycerol dehydrogenase